MDTASAPIGERRLAEIVDAVVVGGDTVESDFLEVKSELDLTAKVGLAKVAKFILGAANRLPSLAERHFRGYAVMVIGARSGAADGVPAGTESHELHEKLARYLGAQGPSWDIARLPVSDGREILFVIVDPPSDGDPPFPCWADFQPSDKQDQKYALRNGDLFVRATSHTRLAKAADVEALARRSAPPATATPVDIQIVAVSKAVRIADSEGLFAKVVADAAANMPSPTATGPFAGIDLGSITGQNRYTQAQLNDRLDRWTRRQHESWSETVDTLAGAVCDGISLRVTNEARSHLPKPRITITLPGCHGVQWTALDRLRMSELLPPVVEPSVNPLMMAASLGAYIPPVTSMNHYPVWWENSDDGLTIELTPTDLRPGPPWITENDDIVVIVDGPEPMVTASWVASVEGMGELFEGSFEVEVLDLEGVDVLAHAEAFGRP